MSLPDSEPIITALYDLEVELEAYAGVDSEYSDQHERTEAILSCDVTETLYADFQYANDITNRDPDALPIATPAHELVGHAVAAARVPNHIEALNYGQGILKDGCRDAEPALARSLNRHARPRPQKNDYPVAVVVHDTQGVPFAYQKTSGHATAYAWREAQVATLDGERYVPADSLLKLDFGDNEPREAYRGHHLGLVALTKGAYVPNTVELVRYSRNLLPPLVAQLVASEPFWRVSLGDGSAYYSFRPREFRLQAAAEIGRRVNRMLASGKAIVA